MNDHVKLVADCLQAKEQGNIAFRSGSLDDAISRYSFAVSNYPKDDVDFEQNMVLLFHVITIAR